MKISKILSYAALGEAVGIRLVRWQVELKTPRDRERRLLGSGHLGVIVPFSLSLGGTEGSLCPAGSGAEMRPQPPTLESWSDSCKWLFVMRPNCS